MKIFGLRKRFYIPPLIALTLLYITAFISPNVDVDHVYKILPVFTFYTNSLFEGDMGESKGIIILIRPPYKNTVVKSHELVHSKQAYRTFFFNWILYIHSDRCRAKMECEAYSTEIENVNQIPSYAKLIKEAYKLNIDTKEIEKYLYEYIK